MPPRPVAVPGFVYVLSNPFLHDADGTALFKVGGTSRTAFERAVELSSASGVPGRFSVAFELATANWKYLERQVHKDLRPFRRDKEFFAAPCGAIIEAIQASENSMKARALARYQPTFPAIDSGTEIVADPAAVTGRLAFVRAQHSTLDVIFEGKCCGRVDLPAAHLTITGPYGTMQFDLPRLRGFDGSPAALTAREQIQARAAATFIIDNEPIWNPKWHLVSDPTSPDRHTLVINGEQRFELHESRIEYRSWFRRRVRYEYEARSLGGGGRAITGASESRAATAISGTSSLLPTTLGQIRPEFYTTHEEAESGLRILVLALLRQSCGS